MPICVLLVVLLYGGLTRAAGQDPAQQRGLVLPTWQANGYQTPATEAALSDIARVGAGWVQIVPTWYQTTVTASEIRPTTDGPDDANIGRVVRLAHAAGLKVLLKPHVDLLDNGDRAEIRPTDRAAWFTAYTGFVNHYAALAARLGVAQFAVGTELSALSGDREPWLRVIEAVRARYGGELVYAENHFAFARVAFWDAVDVIGIDGYWPLSELPTEDVAVLRQSLVRIRDELAAFSARTGKRILFTEMGYASQRGTTTAPWSWTISDIPAPREQAAAYRAVLETFHDQPWWAGVFWWYWRMLPTDSTAPPESLGFSARGKPAEDVLREFWATPR